MNIDKEKKSHELLQGSNLEDWKMVVSLTERQEFHFGYITKHQDFLKLTISIAMELRTKFRANI